MSEYEEIVGRLTSAKMSLRTVRNILRDFHYDEVSKEVSNAIRHINSAIREYQGEEDES